MANVIVPAQTDLATSAQQFRKELLLMPVIALEESTKHMNIRSGIRFRETVGELSGDIQLRPYSDSAVDSSAMTITPRVLETYFGSVVKSFNPNSVYQTIYGSNITKGEALKTTDITRQILGYLSKKIGENLNKVLWSAVRDDAGTTSADLFNGFDTITENEITAGTIAEANGNLFEFTEDITTANAVDSLKAIYEAASDELQGQATKMFLPRSIYNAYVKDYQTSVGAVPYNTEYKKTFLEGTDDLCELVPVANKKGSKFIHLTTASNMLVGVDQMSESENILVEKHEAFNLQFIATMFFGVQFESVSPERLMVAKLYEAPAPSPAQ